MAEERCAYLYDPARAVALLHDLPTLAAAAVDVASDGEPSLAFPLARKSERQFVRVLAGAGYPRVRDLLTALDYGAERGFAPKKLFRTRDRPQFLSFLSECRVAEHLMRRGFTIQDVDATKGAASVPEFIATRDDVRVAVEVVTPRVWEDLWVFADALRDHLKHLDIALDYAFEIAVEIRGPTRAQLHPGELAGCLRAQTQTALVAQMVNEVRSGLTRGRSMRVERGELPSGLHVTVDVRDARPSLGVLPARSGVTSMPGLTGYAPEGMFEHLVRRVISKARRRQASNAETALHTALVVDLDHAEIANELEFEYYRERFSAALEQAFEHGIDGYDVIVLCTSSRAGHGLIAHWVVRDDPAPPELVDALFETDVRHELSAHT